MTRTNRVAREIHVEKWTPRTRMNGGEGTIITTAEFGLALIEDANTCTELEVEVARLRAGLEEIQESCRDAMYDTDTVYTHCGVILDGGKR